MSNRKTASKTTESGHRDRREIRFFIVMSLLCAVGVAALFFGHPSSYPYMPKCPFYLATGLYCPGCGSLRSAHYLMQGNVADSFRNQPLFVPLLACIFFLYAKRLYEFRKGTDVLLKGELVFFKIVLVVILVFFVVRNVPHPALDWTRPPSASQPRP